MTKRNWLLLLLIAPGLVSALILAGHRYSLESHNKAVELALDYAEIQNLSVASHTPVPDLLRQFKSVGITGVAVSEQLLGDLSSTGQISYEVVPSQDGPLTVIHIPDQRLAARVILSLKRRFDPAMADPRLAMTRGVASDYVPHTYTIQAAPATLDLIGIGLPKDAVGIVERSGLDVIARLQNYPSMTPQAIDAAISEMHEAGISRLICAGEEVIGFRGLIESAAKKLEAGGMVYGSVEFAKQRGDSMMSKELDGQFIRVHSIAAAEMATLSAGSAIERFTRAVKERNIRLCYVRLFESNGEDPIAVNSAFILGIRRGISAAGYVPSSARPFGTSTQSKALLVLVALAIAAGTVLVLSSLLTVSARAQFGILAVAFVVFAGLTLVADVGKQATALMAALVFPTLGVVRVIGPYLGRESGPCRHPLLRSCWIFVRTSAYSLIGALLIAGMLGTRPYMVKVEQFMGIKAAHLVPILAVIFVIVAGLPILNQPFSEVWRKMRANLKEMVDSPLFIWQAIAVVFAIAIIGLAVMRTGNDSGIGVSSLELRFRAILDRVLFVRPRTKEFLIGHPALILGVALLLTRRRSWGLPLVALGALGQVSLLNTFCHIHTPLQLTAMRAFNGLVVGLAIGAIVWWIVGGRAVESAVLLRRTARTKSNI